MRVRYDVMDKEAYLRKSTRLKKKHIHPTEKTLSGNKHKSLSMRPKGALEIVKLPSILRHVHIIMTYHALIYYFNCLGKKIF